MGSIMSVVAVLEIHILSAAVAAMKPAISQRGLPPARTSTERAKRLCKSQRSNASAIRNPPMNKKT